MNKKVKTFLKLTIIPYILYLVTSMIYYTNRKTFHFPKTKPTKPFVVSFWHGTLLMQPHLFKKFQPEGTLKAMISNHSDGESIAKMVNHLGLQVIRGSSNQGGIKVLIGAIKELKKDTSIGISPDGPRGPMYTIADGIIALSQKADVDIYYFSYKPTKYWQLNSWDKFIIPKPFGTIDFFVSEPFNLKGLSKEEARQKIKSNMVI